MGAQVDIVCKGRGKEGEEGAENERGAHCGQYFRGQIAERNLKEGLRSTPSGSLGALSRREQAKVDVCGHARHLFPAGIGESGSAQSWPKGKSFGEDMIHF